MGMYYCNNCDNYIDNDYHPCEEWIGDLVCPSCYEDLVAEYDDEVINKTEKNMRDDGSQDCIDDGVGDYLNDDKPVPQETLRRLDAELRRRVAELAEAQAKRDDLMIILAKLGERK